MGHPHPALRVHHRVVRVARVVPDDLVAPVQGGFRHLIRDVRPEVALARGVSNGDPDLPRFVRGRVHPDEVVAGELDAVDWTVRVDLRVALVGRYLIVDVAGRAAPFPHGEHHVAFASLWTRWHRRDLAGHDAIGPVGIHRDGALGPEPAQSPAHHRAALADLHAMRPGGLGRVEVTWVQDLAGSLVPQLVTQLTALFEAVDPRGLTAHIGRDAVAGVARSGKLAGRRHLDQRIPVVGRIDLSRLARIRRVRHPQVERGTG